MYQNKYLEYYLDSRVYSDEDVKRSIEDTKKDFPNKNVNVDVILNDFGVYVITVKFESRNTFFNRIKIILKKKFNKQLLLGSGKKDRMEKYSNGRRYGQYKSTGTYRPY